MSAKTLKLETAYVCIFEENKDRRTGKSCSLVTRTHRDTVGGTGPGVRKWRRPSESPIGFLDIREAELINSQHLVGEGLQTQQKRSPWMPGAGLQVAEPLKQTSLQSKERGASWTVITESSISNRMNGLPTSSI